VCGPESTARHRNCPLQLRYDRKFRGLLDGYSEAESGFPVTVGCPVLRSCERGDSDVTSRQPPVTWRYHSNARPVPVAAVREVTSRQPPQACAAATRMQPGTLPFRRPIMYADTLAGMTNSKAIGIMWGIAISVLPYGRFEKPLEPLYIPARKEKRTHWFRHKSGAS
jgi:hypothetical protein